MSVTPRLVFGEGKGRNGGNVKQASFYFAMCPLTEDWIKLVVNKVPGLDEDKKEQLISSLSKSNETSHKLNVDLRYKVNSTMIAFTYVVIIAGKCTQREVISIALDVRQRAIAEAQSANKKYIRCTVLQTSWVLEKGAVNGVLMAPFECLACDHPLFDFHKRIADLFAAENSMLEASLSAEDGTDINFGGIPADCSFTVALYGQRRQLTGTILADKNGTPIHLDAATSSAFLALTSGLFPHGSLSIPLFTVAAAAIHEYNNPEAVTLASTESTKNVHIPCRPLRQRYDSTLPNYVCDKEESTCLIVDRPTGSSELKTEIYQSTIEFLGPPQPVKNVFKHPLLAQRPRLDKPRESSVSFDLLNAMKSAPSVLSHELDFSDSGNYADISGENDAYATLNPAYQFIKYNATEVDTRKAAAVSESTAQKEGPGALALALVDISSSTANEYQNQQPLQTLVDAMGEVPKISVKIADAICEEARTIAESQPSEAPPTEATKSPPTESPPTEGQARKIAEAQLTKAPTEASKALQTRTALEGPPTEAPASGSSSRSLTVFQHPDNSIVAWPNSATRLNNALSSLDVVNTSTRKVVSLADAPELAEKLNKIVDRFAPQDEEEDEFPVEHQTKSEDELREEEKGLGSSASDRGDDERSVSDAAIFDQETAQEVEKTKTTEDTDAKKPSKSQPKSGAEGSGRSGARSGRVENRNRGAAESIPPKPADKRKSAADYMNVERKRNKLNVDAEPARETENVRQGLDQLPAHKQAAREEARQKTQQQREKTRVLQSLLADKRQTEPYIDNRLERKGYRLQHNKKLDNMESMVRAVSPPLSAPFPDITSYDKIRNEFTGRKINTQPGQAFLAYCLTYMCRTKIQYEGNVTTVGQIFSKQLADEISKLWDFKWDEKREEYCMLRAAIVSWMRFRDDEENAPKLVEVFHSATSLSAVFYALAGNKSGGATIMVQANDKLLNAATALGLVGVRHALV